MSYESELGFWNLELGILIKCEVSTNKSIKEEYETIHGKRS